MPHTAKYIRELHVGLLAFIGGEKGEKEGERGRNTDKWPIMVSVPRYNGLLGGIN